MKVLRNKSGASLMFVLATMMLLMVLGVSVIVAAGYNVGAGVVQYNRTQLELYSSSMERTIKAAFIDVDEDQDEGEPLTAATTLGGQILREAISQSGIFPTPPSTDDIILGPTVIDVNIQMTTDDVPAEITLPGDVEVDYTITITGQLMVFVNPYYRYDTLGDVFIGTDPITGNPIYDTVSIDATPMTITITGDLVVNLLTTFAPVGNMNQAALPDVPYTFESETTYRLNQLVLIEDETNPIPFIEKVADPVLEVMLISPDTPVVWTVIRYESFG